MYYSMNEIKNQIDSTTKKISDRKEEITNESQKLERIVGDTINWWNGVAGDGFRWKTDEIKNKTNNLQSQLDYLNELLNNLRRQVNYAQEERRKKELEESQQE